MHIPDGYLSPSTSITLMAVSAPFLFYASRQTTQKMEAKTIPYISLFSALSFVIMMLNIPLPGGTTGHAVGSALTSIIVGPWAGMLSTTVALVIQALFFGDGGILTLGANVFNMAIVMPLVANLIYTFFTLLSRGQKAKLLWGAIAGYVAINVAAFFTALELGIQPILFHTPSGQSLYFPYSLAVSIPAMMIGHITIAGLAEAIATAFGLSWVLRTSNISNAQTRDSNKHYKNMPTTTSLIILLFILIGLVPLGLLAQGTAWGEWDTQELSRLGLGYIPKGFSALSGIWNAPFSKYTMSMISNTPTSYMLSAIIGVLLIACFFIFLLLLQAKASRLKSTSFIEKNLHSVTELVRYSFFTHSLSKQDGLLQHLNARTKILSLLSLLLTINITASFVVFGSIYLFILLVARKSRIPIKFMLTRVWLFLPFFTGLLAIPLIFNFASPGKPLITVFEINQYTSLAITYSGLRQALLLLTRVGISTSLGILFIVTTDWHHILKALQKFRVPVVFIGIALMTYRYIFLLLEETHRIFLAKKSRTIGPTPGDIRRRQLGSTLMVLFAKTRELSEDVYDAMRSRGYKNTLVLFQEDVLSQHDYMALGLTIMISIFFVFIGKHI